MLGFGDAEERQLALSSTRRYGPMGSHSARQLTSSLLPAYGVSPAVAAKLLSASITRAS